MRFFIAIIVSCLSYSFSFGQTTALVDPSAINRCDTITSIDPFTFIIGDFSFKKIAQKKAKKFLKFGIKSFCVFITDSLGKVLPYEVVSYEFTLPANGGIASLNGFGNAVNNDILIVMHNLKIGSRCFFQSIVIRDKSGTKLYGRVEPLTIEKIK